MSTVRIMIVDDNPAFSWAAKSFLNTNPNLRVVASVTSAAEGLELLDQVKPDLVLMDVVMDRMSGLEATRLIKQEENAPKVVVLTMHNAAEYRASADAAGADGFITKDNLVAELPPLIESLFPGETKESGRKNDS